jgi:hypothetical protein
MVQKIPPPPPFSGPEWQVFNRWLLELTGILGNEGGINPDEVSGLPALFTAVAVNTASIAALQGSSGSQAAAITTLQGQVTTLFASLATVNGQITTLNARGELLFGAGLPAAGLGKVGDWYGDTAGAAGARVFIKKVVGVWTPFPF